MVEADRASEHLKEHLQRLTPQVRCRLLTELERLHLLGEDVPHSEELIALLRVEFRSTLGKPITASELLREPILSVARADIGEHRARARQCWSDRPRIAGTDLEPDRRKAAAKHDQRLHRKREVQNIATAFRKKVLTYLDGVLGSADGADGVRTQGTYEFACHLRRPDKDAARHSRAATASGICRCASA